MQHFLAKEVRSYNADRLHPANTESDEVGGNIACVAKTVALATHSPDGQCCLDGQLIRACIQQPIGVQTKVSKHRNACL